MHVVKDMRWLSAMLWWYVIGVFCGNQGMTVIIVIYSPSACFFHFYTLHTGTTKIVPLCLPWCTGVREEWKVKCRWSERCDGCSECTSEFLLYVVNEDMGTTTCGTRLFSDRMSIVTKGCMHDYDCC